MNTPRSNPRNKPRNNPSSKPGNKPRSGEIGGRLRLDDLGDRTPPSLTVHAVGDDGAPLASAKVADDGTFAIEADALARARRVVIAASDGDPADRATTLSLRPDTVLAALAVGDLTVGPRDWGIFFPWRRCIDATIRRCTFGWPVIRDLVLPAQRSLSPIVDLVWPRLRCSPICVGTVDVYRRTCCCRPPVFEPPILEPELPWEPPIPWPDPWPDPWPGPFPDPTPGPDPVPFDLEQQLLRGGALDVRAASASKDRIALARLDGIERHEYLVARPYLWCTCGGATKVASGFVGEGGSIHVCWSEPWRVLGSRCHDEFAFVVKQNIGGSTVTIYDGVAAGQWFESDDDIRLTSYHRSAIGCADPEFPVPVDGAFVVLQDIGSTESHRLDTPLPDSADSVGATTPTSGLLALGANYAIGGTVQLRYHFSASMQTIGARYYRVQVARANAAGDPVGGWTTVPAPAWDTWRTVGGNILRGSHALGPLTVGAESDLHHIPFETGAPLGAGEEWQDGQFHAVLDTTGLPHDRHLVRIEVFDGAGNRMDPGPDPFTFRRWVDPTNTVAVTYAALTHLIRTENRPVVADVVDVTGPGAGAGDCKFFSGGGAASVAVDVDAYHPAPGPNDFLLSWSLGVRRGINAGNVVPAVTSTTEAGQGVPYPVAFSVDDLLDGEAWVDGRRRCTFTANLHVYARIHDGSSRQTTYDRHDQASFAVEQTS